MKLAFASAIYSAPLILFAMISSGCSGQSNTLMLPDPDDISNLEFSQVLKFASQSYRAVTPEDYANDTTFLTLSTSIQWPMRIDDLDILPLQDELLSAAFSSKERRDVDQAIRDFITRPADWLDTSPDTNIEMVSYTSEGQNDHTLNVTANVTELTMRSITYFVTTMAYLGGAHPNSSITPLTYNFDSQRIVTYADLFLSGSEATLEKIIADQLSIEYNVAADNLTEAGFFNNRIVPTSMVYIQNNMIVFHYNPYEIAPYYFGMIDVALSPYQLRDLLTPYYINYFGLSR